MAIHINVRYIITVLVATELFCKIDHQLVQLYIYIYMGVEG